MPLIMKAFLSFLRKFSHLLDSSTCLRLKKWKSWWTELKRKEGFFLWCWGKRWRKVGTSHRTPKTLLGCFSKREKRWEPDTSILKGSSKCLCCGWFEFFLHLFWGMMMSGRVSLMKGRGVLIVSLWGVDWSFWSHLRCWGQKATVFPLQVLLRVMCKQKLSMISFRCQIKPEPRPNCPLGGYFFSDEHPIHFYIGLPHPGGGKEGIYDTELKQEGGKLKPKITFEENKSVCKNVYTKVFIYMMIY